MPRAERRTGIGTIARFGTIALFTLAVSTARAQEWRPAPGLARVPIWPGAIPFAAPCPPESTLVIAKKLVAGRPWTAVVHVSHPTRTVFPARGRNAGVAVVVFPGGGYRCLAIDLEGTEVCEWLAAHGITGVLLAYRVPDTGPHWNPDSRREEDPKHPIALADAQRAVGLVRARAAEWHVDPHRIGVMGFSAGGHLVADVSTHWNRRVYPHVDAADDTSCRPDFAVACYPGHLFEHTQDLFELNPEIPVTKDTPPTFLVQAVDDPVDPVRNSLVYELALWKAGVPVEAHRYAHGGHAFGLRRTKDPITRWPDRMMEWLEAIGMLATGPTPRR